MKHVCFAYLRWAMVAALAAFGSGFPASGFAQDNPILGSWKLVPEKSSATPGPLPYRSLTLDFSASGEALTNRAKGIDARGRPVDGTYTIIPDGKDHPVTGVPAFDSSSYTKVSDRNTVYVRQKRGTTVIAGSRLVSRDGKTLSFRQKRVNDLGQETGRALLVFERE